LLEDWAYDLKAFVSSAQTAPFCTAALNSHSDAFENIVQSGCPETIPWKAMSRNGFACDVAPAATTADDRLTFSEELVRLDPVKSTRNTAHKLYHHAALRTKKTRGDVAALQRGLIQDRERFYFFDKPIDCPHSHPSFFSRNGIKKSATIHSKTLDSTGVSWTPL
jgi:hypothetical protein